MEELRNTALISWLHDCLAAERSNRGIPNVTGGGVKRRRFIDGRDRVFAGQAGMVDLPPSAAAEMVSAALLYRRECELLLGSWIIAGKVDGRSMMMPVMLHRLLPEAVQGATFPVEADGWRINPSLADLPGLTTEIERELESSFGAGLPGMGGMLAVVRLLGRAVPGLDVTAAEAYPVLGKSGEIEASAAAPGLRLHPAGVVLLAERSAQVRGLLNEARRLAGVEDGDRSVPLRRFLGAEVGDVRSKSTVSRSGWLPVHLSPAQTELLESAATEPLTLCHGPPGTGKTFTLASVAIDHALRDEAVLIVCRSKQAADVVTKAVDGIAGTGEMTLRSGSHAALAKLRSTIDLLLAGAGMEGAPDKREANRRERELRTLLKSLGARSKAFEGSLAAAYRKGKWFDPPGEAGLWVRFQQWRHGIGAKGRPMLMEAAAELQRLEAERMMMAREHLQLRRRHLLANLLGRAGVKDTLRKYRDALRKRGSGEQEAALAALDPQLLLKVFPIWVVESDDLHRLLPLTAGLFPLVMMDEASQCDLASALPVLQRGKRALIGGDPKQLRHVSFLAEEELERLAELQGGAIDGEARERYHFRRRSLIDVVADRASAVHFLSEHFRSRPELIAFSNRRFYGGHLRLMREVGAGTGGEEAASVVSVSGVRDASGVNRAELDAAVDFLERWLDEETGRGGSATVGFLSPLRAQADGFETVVRKRMGHERYLTLLNRHGLTASTAHGFQGDEKDVMLLSFGLTDDCPAGSRRFIERDDVFNVSVTRARNRMVAFRSFDPAKLPADSLLGEWLGSLGRGRVADSDGVGDPFIDEVAKCLEKRGFSCETGGSAAGIPLDLVVRKTGGGSLALDLVGQRGLGGELVPMRQLMLLQRAGLRMLPLGISEWKSDSERCLNEIERRMGP